MKHKDYSVGWICALPAQMRLGGNGGGISKGASPSHPRSAQAGDVNDLESGLRRTGFVGAFRPVIEEDRREEYNIAQAPKHTRPAPTVPTIDARIRDEVSPEEILGVLNARGALGQGTSTFSAASQAINGRARKRRRCMSRFNRKGGDEGEGSDEEEEEQEEERHIRHPKQTWTVVGQLRVTLFRPWMIPLPLIPAGFIVKYLNMSPATIFGVNFIAIFPLGNLITLVTNELILRSSGHQAMVIIVTFQNAVQLVVAIIALVRHQALLVRTSLIGAVFSNIVLIIGIGWFLGGLNRLKQNFNSEATAIHLNLLFLTTAALVIPTTLKSWAGLLSNDFATCSHVISLFLIFTYVAYLVYAFKTHIEVFLWRAPRIPLSPNKRPISGSRWAGMILKREPPRNAAAAFSVIGGRLSAPAGGQATQSISYAEPEDEVIAQLALPTLILTIVIATVLIGFCSTFAVDSIDKLTQHTVLSQTFVGLILLPVLGCNVHAITLARNDYMDDCLSIAIGGSVQIMTFILPLTVIFDWIRGDSSMTLDFDGFQVVLLFVALMVLRYTAVKGYSTWLEGVVLIALFGIIGLGAWFYPSKV